MRAARDGCVALAIFVGHSFLLAGRMPPELLGMFSDVLRADPSTPGVEELLRILAFGSFVLSAIGQAILVALVSLLLRAGASGFSAGRAARTEAREVARG